VASRRSTPAIGTRHAPSPRKVLVQLKGAEVIVIGSGSCGAMLKNFYPELFKDTPQLELAKQISSRTWEFSEFLVKKLGVTDLGAKFPHKVTFHDGCHGLRELGIKKSPRELLGKFTAWNLLR
jgi:L-lactate dehydrogenase complex protein LldE